MYCINCGNKIDSNDSYCTKCGNKLNIDNSKNIDSSVDNKSYSGKKIASIILGVLSIGFSMLIIFAPISLILSVIGLILSFVVIKNEKNVIGIVLNLIGFLISLCICILFIFVIRYVVTNVDSSFIDNFKYSEKNNELDFGDYGEKF